MPKPIAKTCAELDQWLRDFYDPEIATLLVIGPDGWAYDRDTLAHCSACNTNSLHEFITNGVCGPCFQDRERDYEHKQALGAMVRRL